MLDIRKMIQEKKKEIHRELSMKLSNKLLDRNFQQEQVIDIKNQEIEKLKSEIKHLTINNTSFNNNCQTSSLIEANIVDDSICNNRYETISNVAAPDIKKLGILDNLTNGGICETEKTKEGMEKKESLLIFNMKDIDSNFKAVENLQLSDSPINKSIPEINKEIKYNSHFFVHDDDAKEKNGKGIKNENSNTKTKSNKNILPLHKTKEHKKIKSNVEEFINKKQSINMNMQTKLQSKLIVDEIRESRIKKQKEYSQNLKNAKLNTSTNSCISNKSVSSVKTGKSVKTMKNKTDSVKSIKSSSNLKNVGDNSISSMPENKSNLKDKLLMKYHKVVDNYNRKTTKFNKDQLQVEKIQERKKLTNLEKFIKN